AEAQLEPQVDLTHRLEVLGLRNLLQPPRVAAQEIGDLTHRTGAGMARNMLVRAGNAGFSRTAKGDDRIADAKDLTARGRDTTVRDVLSLVSSEYLGLLAGAAPVERGAQAIVFDLVPSRLVILNRGSVDVRGDGMPRTLKLFATSLARG